MNGWVSGMCLSSHLHLKRVMSTRSTFALDQKAASSLRTPDGLSRSDFWLMSTGFLLCLLISYVFGHGRIFWEDEMLGWMMLRDPSWRHMLFAWKEGADGGSLSFYLSGRIWFALFGASEVAFRAYSATCFGLAFCATWVTARHFYSRNLVAFALFNTWFASPPLVIHMGEGRFYGLLMCSTSLVVWMTAVRLQKTIRASAADGLLFFLLHALLTTSHVLGVLYSAVLLGALIVLDRLQARWRPALYIGGAAAWLLLIPERTAILASANVGKPHFWTLPPNLSRFLGAFTGYSAEIALVLLVLFSAVAWSLLQRKEEAGTLIRQAFEQRQSIHVLTGALLLVPIGLAIKSTFGTSLFINRYLIPVTLAQAFVTAEALTLVDWRALPAKKFLPLSTRMRRALIASYVVVLSLWIFGHLRRSAIGQKNYTDELTARLPKGIPVLCEDAWAFTEIIGRQHASGVQYTYLLDWAQSMDPSAPRLEVTQFHLMQNWVKVGYFSGSIQDRQAFLKRYPVFLVLHNPDASRDEHGLIIGNPLVETFLQNRAYETRLYLHGGKGRLDVWEVCRGTCAAAGAL